MQTITRLHEVRRQRGVAAAELAKLAGVNRQTIYAIEAGNYVPNTALALQLARILEVRVEDLFSLQADASAPLEPVTADLIGGVEPARKGQPVQLCHLGNRLIGVPATPQPVMLPPADGVIAESGRRTGQAEVCVFQTGIEKGKRLLIAGCDPGISLLGRHLARFDDIDLIVAPSSSQQALAWLKTGKVHIAGSHLRDASSGEYNLPLIQRLFPRGEVKVVTFAVWEQGMVIQSGNPKKIRAIEDLSRKDVRIINREKGAGSRELLDQRLRESGVPPGAVNGYDRVARGHLPAALAVSLGEADCCIATHSAARAFGLSFVPLATERYDLVMRREHLRLKAVQALLDALSRADLRRKLEMLAGYDTRHTGEVLAG
jgi:putative molybdopterin biosynthesis protein